MQKKKKKKNEKKVFVFEIIASELVALNSFKQIMLVIGSQCVNKWFYDFAYN